MEHKNWECAAAVPWIQRGECAAAVPCQKQGVRFGRPLDSAGVRFGRPWERSSGLAGLQHVCIMFCPCSGVFMVRTLGALGLVA